MGGTIAMTPDGAGGVVPTLTSKMLIAAVPGLEDVAHIDAQSFRQLPSAHLSFDDLYALAAEITRVTRAGAQGRSEEHTSELQSLMRISYAVFCFKPNHN